MIRVKFDEISTDEEGVEAIILNRIQQIHLQAVQNIIVSTMQGQQKPYWLNNLCDTVLHKYNHEEENKGHNDRNYR